MYKLVKKIINIKNICWLLYGYIGIIISLVFISFEFPKNFWQQFICGKLPEYRIITYCSSNRIGEETLALRVHRTFEKLKIMSIQGNLDDSETGMPVINHLFTQAANILYFLVKPKFNLMLTHHVNIVPRGYKIVYLNINLDELYTAEYKFVDWFKHLNKYDAYIDLYSFVHGDNQFLRKIIQATGKEKPIVPLYLAHEFTPYRVKTKFDRALMIGSLWGCNRNSLRMKLALQKLAGEKLVVAYGLANYFNFLQNGYKGFLFAKNTKLNGLDHIDKIFQQESVSLIVHNLGHMLDGIPTLRVAESAAQSMLIISDENVFIKKFFGDAVLYFNAFAQEQDIYQQIKDHIIWAQNNPRLAQQKIHKAHKIFSANFSLEKQLKKLVSLRSRLQG